MVAYAAGSGISSAKILALTLSLCLWWGGGSWVRADVLSVPGTFPTIQGAIDTAVDGDTVVVAPGTYNEAIDFLGKAIVVVAEQGPDVTTLSGPVDQSLVTFSRGETEASILEGFTVREGTGTFLGHLPYGGAVLCVATSPVIRGCRFVENSALGRGGAVYCRYAARPRIESCEFDSNEANGSGGAIDCSIAGAVIVDCEFRQNSINAINGWRANLSVSGCTFRDHPGSAIRVHAFDGPDDVTIEGCRFFRNGSAVSSDSLVVGSRLIVSGCRIESSRNAAMRGRADVVRLERNAIVRNDTSFDNAVVTVEGQVESTGNVIAWNNSETSGLRLLSGSLVSLHDTILENEAPAQVESGGSMILNSSIVWASAGFVWGGSPPTFERCLLHREVALGEHNIVGDPLVVDSGGDAHLRIESPCVDAGDPGSTGLPELDIDGDLRIVAGRPQGESRPDIGADEMRPELAARYGSVDASTPQAIASVLFLNGGVGASSTREVQLAAGEPVTIDLVAPPTGPVPAPFALYAWRGEPSIDSVTEQPYRAGWTAMPTPLQGATPDEVWNNIGFRRAFGIPTRGSMPAPSRIVRVPGGLSPGTIVTLQGFILDEGSGADLPGLSVSNAIVIRVGP